ncbi:MAG: hypothetical protein QNJ46_22380 [Leptolyngbyaceae cyanobacterium MO_188.B28]|nr:hypothetical protein [Leptolyngbyaceae cyanobacterium MO_188.B28]
MKAVKPPAPEQVGSQVDGKGGNTMRAIVQSEYGSPDVLSLEKVDKPVLQDNRVLVKVHAASVNAGDWHLMLCSFSPYPRGLAYFGGFHGGWQDRPLH